MALLTLHGTSRLLPVSQLRHYEPVPPVRTRLPRQRSPPSRTFPLPAHVHWVAADLRRRLKYRLQFLFGQHRLIGLHGIPEDQAFEAGGVLVQS